MQPHQELALSNHIKQLDSKTLQNLRAHADAVDHEDHASAGVIMKWASRAVAGLVGPGMIWKIIKVIKRH